VCIYVMKERKKKEREKEEQTKRECEHGNERGDGKYANSTMEQQAGGKEMNSRVFGFLTLFWRSRRKKKREKSINGGMMTSSYDVPNITFSL
jgi:hypothetical protein